MTNIFIENSKDKEAIENCSACSELELMLYAGISSDLFDSESVVFVSSEVKQQERYFMVDGESTQVMVLRFLQLIEFKYAEDQYCIMKTLNLDRDGKLRLLYIKKSSKYEGGEAFMKGLKDALVPFSLYSYAGDFSISDVPFSQRHFTNEPMVTLVPKMVHLHQNSSDPEFPHWAQMHLDSINQIANDSMNFINHKTYSLLGILKYIEVRILPNYLNEQQNSEAFLILTDENRQEFEVHVWGSAKKFSTFNVQDIIFLSNFKIDRPGKTGTVELRSIGFSDIIKDPYFIDPDTIEKLQQVIPHCFISSVEQLPYFQQNIRLVLLNCFIQSAEIIGKQAYVLFVDSHNNLFRAAIRNPNKIEKIQQEDNLEIYRWIPFNLLLRVNPQVSLVPFSHMIELEVDYFN